MDDQAQKLRQLVRTVRHAATVATGPPSIVVFTSSDLKLGRDCLSSLSDICRFRGISVNIGDRAGAARPSDWHLILLVGPYRIIDYELWQRASAAVVVTLADNDSIVESYRSLKLVAQHTPLPPLELMVLSDANHAEVEVAAARFQQTCKKFMQCCIAGVTHGSPTAPLPDIMASLVDRLTVMAPVASTNLNSPLAVNDS